MQLYFQCGSGIKKLAEVLSEAMPGGTYILSPRDLRESGQMGFAKSLGKSGNRFLFDPQLYAHGSDKKNFKTYGYWPMADYETQTAPWRDLTRKVKELNDALGTSELILPGTACERVGSNYLRNQEQIIRVAGKSDRPMLATVLLKQNVLLDTVQVERLLVAAEAWPVGGVYLIAEHPDEDYFVDSPVWLLNLLKLCSGLTIQGKKVILGYANHQMLIAACTGVHAIASGNWMNARSFTFEKFKESNEIKRHKIWYYAPQAFTEFSAAYLDVALNAGMLPVLAPDKQLATPASILFMGSAPSSVNFTNEMSFFHYLYCLNRQVRELSASHSFGERMSAYREMAGNAKKTLAFLHKHRINGQNRDFMDYFDVNDTALDLFGDQAGPLLSRMNHLFVDK